MKTSRNNIVWKVLSLALIMLLVAACQPQAPADEPEAAEAPAETDSGEESMAESDADAAPAASSDEPILVGHLTYHTGAFGAFGEFFDAVTDFTIDIINEDPPLGREMVSVHQDIGTIGEAQAARKLIDSDGVDVLLNAAHEYYSYRDWMTDYIAENDAPLMPSVHGGAIEREVGGIAEEPLFRGSPMDSALGVSAVLQASEEGAESIAIVAVEIAGSQLQKDAATSAADQLGIEVVEIIDIQPEQPTYRSEVSKIESAAPDAVIMFSPPEEGGTLVKNAAESGLSLIVIGTNEWQEQEFIKTATMEAVEQHELVGIVSFAHAESPAWDYFEPLWTGSGNADLGGADNSYTMQYYDLLIVTALAIESAGSTEASAWAAAVPNVTGGDGKTVYTYQEGIDAIRAGEAINYSGVTGEFDYTETGVVSGLFGIIQWVSEEDFELVSTLDDATILALDSGTYTGEESSESMDDDDSMAAAPAGGPPITVGHLTYHTGPFGAFGEFFDAVTDFTLEIINEHPPLGREMVSIHQDIGTIGEAQASRKLLDSEGVDVLLNPAHEYYSYQDYMLQYIADNDAPLMPSVHGGAIAREVGGIGEEPLFRGSPMDSALGVSAVLQASERGAESIVIVAVEIAGSQLQKDAATSAAEQLGIEVADIIDIQPEQPTYRSEVSKISNAEPDAVIMFSPPEEGGTLVKNAAEAGLSLIVIGTNEWQEQEFIKTATMDAVNQHQLVGIVSFAHAESPAWDYFEPLWNDSGHAELGGADNSYTMQYYDLLIVTALAIEAAGSTNASEWAAAVPQVSGGDGTVVYTYAEGIEALRAGEAINYSGVTGEFDYTDTG
ncbi:MAG: ABC transporter substrate-binding protein, partial [Chloroflexota bacterium]